ncbi:MAG: lytic transglycosylase domain-containing protein [Planctomycetota bacterium]
MKETAERFRLASDTLHLMGAEASVSPRRKWAIRIGLGLAIVGCVVMVTVLVSSRNETIRTIVQQAAIVEGLDPLLAQAVVFAESGGNPEARSRAGAVGLMQLVPATASEMAQRPISGDELTDPRLNAALGCRYLAYLLRRYNGDLLLSLMAYNAGPGRVAKWRKKAPGAKSADLVKQQAFPETRAYVVKVVRKYNELRKAAD